MCVCVCVCVCVVTNNAGSNLYAVSFITMKHFILHWLPGLGLGPE